jgi:uncharacterized protein YbjT (DUF2867 family)
MILVIGGRSKIGSALIELLVEKEEPVRALARDGESADAFPAAVDVARGDLANTASLAAAMAGVGKVFLLSTPHPDVVAWHRNAIDAAREAGVGLLVRSSILGADENSPAEFVSSHGISDRYLEQSGLEHVILRPNMFMQNVPESTIPSIGADGNFYLDAGGARLSMVDTRDVAGVAAAVLTEPGHAGARYDVTGPEALSYDDVAIKLSRALGRPVNYVNVPDDSVREALIGAGLDEWFAGTLVGLFQEYRRSGPDGYAAEITDTVDRVTGRAARSLGELLEEARDG